MIFGTLGEVYIKNVFYLKFKVEKGSVILSRCLKIYDFWDFGEVYIKNVFYLKFKVEKWIVIYF
jgi:hypothetical protein